MKREKMTSAVGFERSSGLRSAMPASARTPMISLTGRSGKEKADISLNVKRLNF